MRTRWDPLIDARDDILIQLDAYRDAGVGHVVAEPAQRTVDDYLRSIEALAEIFSAAGVAIYALSVVAVGRLEIGRGGSGVLLADPEISLFVT